MRVSTQKDDPGFREDTYRFEVFLNGKRLDNCITADEEQMYVWVYKKGEDGKLSVDDYGRFIEEKLIGAVKIYCDTSTSPFLK